MKKRICIAIQTILAALILTGCGTGGSILTIDEKNYTTPSNKIAVIAGDNHSKTLFFVSKITDELKKKTTLNVLSQGFVSKKIGGYPINIKGPFKRGLASETLDYSNTDANTINKIQKNLKADYLLVVWLSSKITETIGGGISIFQLDFAEELYINSGKRIGKGQLTISWGENFIIIGGSKDIKMDTFENSAKTALAPGVAADLANQLKVERK